MASVGECFHHPVDGGVDGLVFPDAQGQPAQADEVGVGLFARRALPCSFCWRNSGTGRFTRFHMLDNRFATVPVTCCPDSLVALLRPPSAESVRVPFISATQRVEELAQPVDQGTDLGPECRAGGFEPTTSSSRMRFGRDPHLRRP
ncbi:hypothetical protein CP970_08625 [Streptomyces kanamyceticus]|uniref:Uncharacterized protein n=1 Tax=Streptomyces kanamyceticus TaxID=1967 RepID=A0A5J6G5U8_STRKN|nr:hypothetical protein CP970_08625 [Streptomyces kanamyceticus]